MCKGVPVGVESLEYGLDLCASSDEDADIYEITMAIDSDAVILGDFDFEVGLQ